MTFILLLSRVRRKRNDNSYKQKSKEKVDEKNYLNFFIDDGGGDV